MAVPVAGGVVLLVLGLTRRRRQQRVAPRTGQVLDQEFVSRHLRELRHGGRGGD